MIRSFLAFVVFGILWLFLFSTPIGEHGKKLYDLGYYYLVDNSLVHQIRDIIFTSAHKTEQKASDVVNDVLQKADKHLP